MKTKAVGLIGLSAILWLLVLGNGCDKGVEPGGEATGYPFSFRAALTSVYYSYCPETDELDSLSLPFAIGDGQLSADGRELFVNTANGIEAVNLSSQSRRLVWAHQGMIAPSPDGKLIAVQDGQVHILRTDDLSIVFEDTLALYYAVFSADSKSLYALNYDFDAGLSIIYRVTMNRPIQVTQALNYHGSLYTILPSKTQRRLFIHGEVRDGDHLLVYDTGTGFWAKDSVIVPGAGKIALSPDGRYLIVTNPGQWPAIVGTPNPPWTISVFDATSLDLVTDITTKGVFPGDTSEMKFLVREIAVSPDSKWLVGLDAIGWNFVAVNLHDLKIEHLGRLKNRTLTGLTVQSRLR